MKLALLLFTYLFCLLAHGQDYKALVNLAYDKYTKKEYTKSVELYQRAFYLAQNNQSDLYNGACSAALTNNPSLALTWLNMAFNRGYTDLMRLRTDHDLTSLRTSQKWKDLLVRMQKKIDQIEVNYDKPLQKKLIAIYDEDQKYRMQLDTVGQQYGFDSKEIKAVWKTINEKDSLNLLTVKTVLDQYGWVGEDKIGPKANQTLFLVIQHADLLTQQAYLPMMRQAVKAGKAQAKYLALLEDRVALGERRRQTYGSQIGSDSTGAYCVAPLEDPDTVDQRRAAVGLEPLAEYVKQWGINWNVATYKKQLPGLDKQAGIKQ